jgi:predicted transposase YbfD/YdcC
MPTPKAPKTPLPKSLKVFSAVDDPRRQHPTTLHKLSDIIGLTIMATLGGASNWVEIELWAKAQREWLTTILELPHGIPSHDTISRVFALLDPSQMVQAFTQWTSELAAQVKGVVALDGKTVRRSMSAADGRGPIHVVNAFAAESHLVLTQLKVEDKSNEIIALPKIIGMLDLENCVATVDAMGCQVEVAKAVKDQHGDTMLQIKDNQPTLHDDVKKLFDWALDPSLPLDQRIPQVESESLNKGHGRLERRQCTGIKALEGIDSLKRWPGARSVWRVESTRTVGKKATIEHRYYLSSLPASTADHAAHANHAIRRHWSVENEVHWVLDVAMDEDLNRSRVGNSAQNLALMRKLVLNLLRLEKGSKGGVKARQKRAGWDHEYLLQVLSLG